MAACNTTNDDVDVTGAEASGNSTNTTTDNDESVAPGIEGEATNTTDNAADAPPSQTAVAVNHGETLLQSVPMHVSIIYHTQYEVVVLDTTNLAPYTSFYLPYKQALPVPVHMH